jgi:hypothetical protein
MRFHIDYDDDQSIRGWIVPDNPLAISRVVAVAEGKRVGEIAAFITDDEIRRNGWHATGQCIFILTDAEIPGLSTLQDLELYDADTNVRIYRRAPGADFVQQRFLLINTGIKPETALQVALFPHFRHCYFGLNQLTDEIATSILSTQMMPSAFLAGAVTVPRYENYMTPDVMLTGILVQEPYLEMATRLLWLKERAAEANDPAQRWRLGRLAEAASFTDTYDLTDARSLKRYFRMLPEPAYRLLFNPLMRQLGTRMPDDRLYPGNSIAAIEVLARLGIVGHHARFDVFATALLDRLGLDILVPAAPALPQAVLDLAKRLRSVRAVDEMLVFDIAMTDMVKATVDKIWAS